MRHLNGRTIIIEPPEHKNGVLSFKKFKSKRASVSYNYPVVIK